MRVLKAQIIEDNIKKLASLAELTRTITTDEESLVAYEDSESIKALKKCLEEYSNAQNEEQIKQYEQQIQELTQQLEEQDQELASAKEARLKQQILKVQELKATREEQIKQYEQEIQDLKQQKRDQKQEDHLKQLILKVQALKTTQNELSPEVLELDRGINLALNAAIELVEHQSVPNLDQELPKLRDMEIAHRVEYIELLKAQGTIEHNQLAQNEETELENRLSAISILNNDAKEADIPVIIQELEQMKRLPYYSNGELVEDINKLLPRLQSAKLPGTDFADKLAKRLSEFERLKRLKEKNTSKAPVSEITQRINDIEDAKDELLDQITEIKSQKDDVVKQTNKRLLDFFAQRWSSIANSLACYTREFDNLNAICVDLAFHLADTIDTAEQIEQLEPNTGPYFILMPTLVNSYDVYRTNIHRYGIGHFIVSDDLQVIVPIKQCISNASKTDTGQFEHVVARNELCPALTPAEINRISVYQDLDQALKTYNYDRLHGTTSIDRLEQLAISLRNGNYRGDGQHEDSGASANIGIAAFKEYWDTVSADERMDLFNKAPVLEDRLGRLFRPKDARFLDTTFCVDIISGDIFGCVEALKRSRPDRSYTLNRLNALLDNLDSRLEEKNKRHFAAKPPKFLLSKIHKLSADEQSKLLHFDGYTNALDYAIKVDLEALPLFELNEADQRRVITQPASADFETILIKASHQGLVAVINTLVTWGAQPDDKDSKGMTALHHATKEGHIEAVTALLNKGANIDAVDNEGRSALHYALTANNRKLFACLIAHQASMNLRNDMQQNIIDLAATTGSPLLDELLIPLARLPQEQHADHLSQCPNAPYYSVYEYIIEEHPNLLNSYINRIFLNQNKAKYQKTDENPNPPEDRITKALEQMKFDNHLSKLMKKCELMRTKAQTNPKYLTAAKAATRLLGLCVQAQADLYTSDDTAENKLHMFKATCLLAIENSKPVLSKHREIMKLIGKLALGLATLPVTVFLLAFGVFSLKTNTRQMVDALGSSIEKYQPPIQVA